MTEPLVSIVVPNYNTGPLLRLSVESARLRTRLPHEVIVVDNGSRDESRAFVEERSARGALRLIRRDGEANRGAATHGSSLDLGLAAARAPLVLTLDSDAWARRNGWLEDLVARLDGEGAALCGATKELEARARLLRAASRLVGREAALPPEYRYVRPCHALYRAAAIREAGLSFLPDRDLATGRARTTGEALHHGLIARGHRAAIVPFDEMKRMIGHVKHATLVLNAAEFPGLKRAVVRRGLRRIERLLASREAREVLDGEPSGQDRSDSLLNGN